jgi:hypothetical protein
LQLIRHQRVRILILIPETTMTILKMILTIHRRSHKRQECRHLILVHLSVIIVCHQQPRHKGLVGVCLPNPSLNPSLNLNHSRL